MKNVIDITLNLKSNQLKQSDQAIFELINKSLENNVEISKSEIIELFMALNLGRKRRGCQYKQRGFHFSLVESKSLSWFKYQLGNLICKGYLNAIPKIEK